MGSNKEINATFKVFYDGRGGSGKSAINDRLVNNRFKNNYLMTVGVNNLSRKVELNGKTYKLSLWDFAGQPRFAFMYDSYIRGSHGVIHVADLTSDNEFTVLDDTSLIDYENNKMDKWPLYVWIKKAKDHAPGVPAVIIGNKSDAVDPNNPKYSDAEMNKFSQEVGVPFIKTSAKTGLNIIKAHDILLEEMIANLESQRSKI